MDDRQTCVDGLTERCLSFGEGSGNDGDGRGGISAAKAVIYQRLEVERVATLGDVVTVFRGVFCFPRAITFRLFFQKCKSLT